MYLDPRQHRPVPLITLPLPLFLLFLLLLATPARSQASYDLTLTSRYAARGAALGSHPALQLRAEVDAETARYAGWYGGAFASPIDLEGREQGQLIAYLGRAQRLTSTLSWDAGATRSVFTRDGGATYTEFYAGLALQRASARLFYSPAYYGEGRTVYLDLNGAYRLDDSVHLAVHAGLLHPFGAYPGATGGADVRIALGTDVDAVTGTISVEAGWQVKAHAYLAGARAAPALTASASLRF